ncbi:hypothetical protein P9E76_17290 [Schinkia azotoformans]|uniref:hypothetical protein n=1 Tax=Schinkia azotoformans TaxID=1454 RepID=UPI00031118FD|nr:hypothetical protein [Schinkia azotoformans]MEC1638812.1 hypothetical protein [Schinkia azotoformans]MEC1720838.1 hypothetical protein [Schinkia azotoformans]MEC1946777.1 hypothetical protein [Schinkia azotoformans]MED4353210.1 hypothetical protein [Schinkia azotoformans]MED4412089.1 hypothetical protein [Schinkia azotoformans]
MKKSSFLVIAFILFWSLFIIGCEQANGPQLKEDDQQLEATTQQLENVQQEKSFSL